MSKQNLNSVFLMFMVIVISAFAVVAYTWFVGEAEITVAGFENVFYGLDQFFENPIAVGWLASIIVSVWGWLENYTQTKEPFDPSEFAKTFCLYEPIIILMSQWLPIPMATVVTFGVHVVRRIVTYIKAKPTPIPTT